MTALSDASTDMSDIVNETVTLLTAAKDNISKATTADQVNSIVDQANEIARLAQENYDLKLAAYNEAKANVATAKANVLADQSEFATKALNMENDLAAVDAALAQAEEDLAVVTAQSIILGQQVNEAKTAAEAIKTAAKATANAAKEKAQNDVNNNESKINAGTAAQTEKTNLYNAIGTAQSAYDDAEAGLNATIQDGENAQTEKTNLYNAIGTAQSAYDDAEAGLNATIQDGENAQTEKTNLYNAIGTAQTNYNNAEAGLNATIQDGENAQTEKTNLANAITTAQTKYNNAQKDANDKKTETQNEAKKLIGTNQNATLDAIKTAADNKLKEAEKAETYAGLYDKVDASGKNNRKTVATEVSKAMVDTYLSEVKDFKNITINSATPKDNDIYFWIEVQVSYTDSNGDKHNNEKFYVRYDHDGFFDSSSSTNMNKFYIGETINDIKKIKPSKAKKLLTINQFNNYAQSNKPSDIEQLRKDVKDVKDLVAEANRLQGVANGKQALIGTAQSAYNNAEAGLNARIEAGGAAQTTKTNLFNAIGTAQNAYDNAEVGLNARIEAGGAAQTTKTNLFNAIGTAQNAYDNAEAGLNARIEAGGAAQTTKTNLFNAIGTARENYNNAVNGPQGLQHKIDEGSRALGDRERLANVLSQAETHLQEVQNDNSKSELYGKLLDDKFALDASVEKLKGTIKDLRDRRDKLTLPGKNDQGDYLAVEIAKSVLATLEGVLADTEGDLARAEEDKAQITAALEDVQGKGEDRKDQIARDNASTIQGGINQRKFDPDDDGDDSSSTTTTPGSGPFVTYTTPDNEFTLIPVGYAGAGAGAGAGAQAGGRMVASNRAADRSGVLGVRAEEETDTKKAAVDTTKKDDNSSSDNKGSKDTKETKDTKEQNLVKVENNLVPLADTPFEEGAGMNWAWLLAAAAAAGAGAYGYGKHKKAVAANEEMKKYKK